MIHMTHTTYITFGLISGFILAFIYWFPTLIEFGKVIKGYVKDKPYRFRIRDCFGNSPYNHDLIGEILFVGFFTIIVIAAWIMLWPILLLLTLIVGIVYGLLRLIRYINRTKRTFKTISEHAHSHENGETKKVDVDIPKF